MAEILDIEHARDARDLRILDNVDALRPWPDIAQEHGVSVGHIDELVNATLEADDDR